MGLNVSSGNMYEFISHTFNTIKGKCYHDCSYCYCKSIAKRFNKIQSDVKLDEKELTKNLGKGNFIFVGSSCDMWADDIPEEWIDKTIIQLQKFDNKYFFQSKDPLRFQNYEMDKRFSFCTTLETNRFYPEIMGKSPKPEDRCWSMNAISETNDTYVTIEPILDFDLKEFVELIKICNPKQVNIGADSGHNKLPEPSKVKVKELISELQKFTIIHNKSNLARLL